MPQPSLHDFTLHRSRSTFAVKANADNALATATKAASPGHRHYFTEVDVAYTDSAISGTMTIKSGATVLVEKRVHGAGAFDFGDFGLAALAVNEAISVELTASGTALKIGYVNLVGYTVPEMSASILA